MPSAKRPMLLSMTLKYVLRLTAIATARRMLTSLRTGLRVVSHKLVEGLTAPMVPTQSASWTCSGGAWPFRRYGRVPGTLGANSPAHAKYWFMVPVVFKMRQLRLGSRGALTSVTNFTLFIFLI